MSLAQKFALICTVLVLMTGGASYAILHHYSTTWQNEFAERDRQLARMLAGLRTGGGALDFNTLAAFVRSSDRAKTGLVYAMLLDRRGGALREGALNPRLFATLDERFKPLVLQGRQHVLGLLSRGEVERSGTIKEVSAQVPGGVLKLGFDVLRIDRQVDEARRIGLIILGVFVLVGMGGAFLLSTLLTAPVRRLSTAMARVAQGETDQSVQVGSADELSAMARSFNAMTRSLKERDLGREFLARYLTPQVVDRILKEDNALEMVAEERGVTVLCVAFPGVTTLAADADARQLLKLLNNYLAPILDGIIDRDGIVLGMDGRRLYAFWGALEPVRDPELRALEAARAARDGARQEARMQVAVGGEALEPTLGIASGRAVTGNLGSARRLQYSVLGGPVEIADHLARMGQPGEILVAEAAFAKLREHVSGSPCAPLIVEDMEEAVPVYRVQ